MARDRTMRSLVALAKPQPDLTSLIDPDHASFLHPDDMTVAIDEFCRSTNQPVPSNQARVCADDL